MFENKKLSKEEKIKRFDPNGPVAYPSLFGLPFSYAESETVVIPIPWEATVSYSAGTAKAPEAILQASSQVDLFDPFLQDAWQKGIYLAESDPELARKGMVARQLAIKHIEALEGGRSQAYSALEVNEFCEEMVEWVKAQTTALMDDGKRIGLLGGDHSTPLGFIQALAERYESFGILQIDAHADLRGSYEGFNYSHASIMHNALKTKAVNVLTQIGVRDYCQEELDVISSDKRVHCFFDQDLKFGQYKGQNWLSQCEEIIATLPERVYISFDIDGLKPYLCPGTGTPVAGGFEIDELLFLIKLMVDNGRKIIGFDLNEVAPQEGSDWDANVGARLLYRLCNLMALSHQD